MGIMKTKVSYIIAVLLGLSGCATAPKDCDPAQGGYLRGIGCSASSAYDQRQQAKNTTLHEERSRQYQLQSKYGETVTEERAVRSRRRAAETQYASLHRDLDVMEARLANTGSGGADLREDITDLKSETSMLEQDTFTPEVEKAKRLERLLREKAALERETDMALRR